MLEMYGVTGGADGVGYRLPPPPPPRRVSTLHADQLAVLEQTCLQLSSPELMRKLPNAGGVASVSPQQLMARRSLLCPEHRAIHDSKLLQQQQQQQRLHDEIILHTQTGVDPERKSAVASDSDSNGGDNGGPGGGKKSWALTLGLFLVASALVAGIGLPLALELRSSNLLEARLRVVRKILSKTPLIDGFSSISVIKSCKMLFSCLVYSLLTTLVVVLANGKKQLETVFQWRYIDYNWPSETVRQQAIKTGEYNHTQVMPMDVDMAPDGRVFLSFMNFRGVPARLGYVTNYENESGPLIEPYPSWEWASKYSCDSLWDVYRMTIDRCNRLWILDTGKEYRTKQVRKCRQKLLVFDLATDTLIRKVVFPDHIVMNPITKGAMMANIKVETYGPNCEDTTVYMAETNGNALVIWDMKKLVRLESPVFQPVFGAANITIGSESEIVAAGILGMDLSPITRPNEPRLLYFRPVASYGLYYASTDQLRNSLSGGSVDIYGRQDVLSSQSLGQAFSSDGTLFLGLTKEIALGCYNRYNDLAPENVETLVQDSIRLQYPNGIKVISWPILPEEQVWILTNRYPYFMHGKLNFNEINYFVLKSPVASLIAGTKCEKPFDLPLAYSAKKNSTTKFFRSTNKPDSIRKVGFADVKSFEITSP